MLDILHRELVYLRYYFELQLRQILPYWVLGMVIGSVISVFCKGAIHRLFGSIQDRKLGALGVIPASALGIASPLCMYGTIPLAASFSQRGMADDWLAAFMMSSILLNPQLIIYSTALGPVALAIRILSSFLCGAAAGLLVRWCFRGKHFFNFDRFSGPTNRDTDPNPVLRLLKNIGRNVKATGPWFLLGIALSALEHQSEGGSTVYYISDITPEAIVAVYEALGWAPTGRVAVKLSTGEPPNSNYLRPELIKDVVQKVDGTIVENNTAYGGSRAETAMHYQVARDHGFNDIADVVILDENGSMSLLVNGGSVLTENLVGAHFADYDSYLVLSHFKGHAMAGFGGAIKNISIGLGSAEGKCLIHTGGKSHTSPWGGDQTAFTESMAEAGKSVSDYLGGGARIVYVNVMNRISIDCDCDGNPHEPDIHDIGILASADPVALDQACVDIVSRAQGNESLMQRIERQQGIHTLEHAQDIGLGSRSYQLVDIGG